MIKHQQSLQQSQQNTININKQIEELKLKEKKLNEQLK